MSHTVLSERGSATVFVVIALALMLFAGSTVGAVGGIVVAHRRAQSAADLAALAGAAALGTAADPCAQARVVAEANAASLDACERSGADLTVVISVDCPRLIRWIGRSAAKARAGR